MKCKEYNNYLKNHIKNVQRAWKENLLPPLINLNLEDRTIRQLEKNLYNHDRSKTREDEYDPYRVYFYPCEGENRNEDAFNKAWLLHIHRNPHHWQYWVLVEDSGEMKVLDMPFIYVCEMLCDWHSFSEKNKESTAFNWYKDNKHKMKLSNNTIKEIEMLIVAFKTPLESKKCE